MIIQQASQFERACFGLSVPAYIMYYYPRPDTAASDTPSMDMEGYGQGAVNTLSLVT